jgi:protoporphyrinogen oxidase
MVIVGAGITGITVARLLQQRGFDDLVILEKESEPGGLCRSKLINGHVLDIGGGHFLCSRYPEVYQFIFAHLPESEFNCFTRVSKLVLGGDVIDYPLEYNIWQLPKERQIEYLISCIRTGEQAGSRQPKNFREWIEWKLGHRIANDYMLPYNRKIWGVEPDELDVDWLEKIPPFDLHRIVETCLAREPDLDKMPSHQSFYYPKQGGFQTIFDAIHARVQEKVRLSMPLRSLRRDRTNWIVNDEYSTPTIVNTIPWPVFHHKVSRPPAGLTRDLQRLKTSALVVSLHEAPYRHDWHWCYVPDPELAHHREFFIQNYAPHSAPNGLYRETNRLRWQSARDAIYVHDNQDAYPIPLRGHTAAADKVRNRYAESSVLGVGRWGQHRYFNSDVCIREAMKLVERFIEGGVESAADTMRQASSRGLS